MEKNYLTVSILSPEHTLFQGRARTVSLKNQRGPFDILPQHTSFISTIEDVVILDDGQSRRRLAIGHGLVYCRQNHVKIFVLPRAS